MRGHQDHLGGRDPGARRLEHAEPVHVGHPQIGDDDLERLLLQLGEGRPATASPGHCVPVQRQRFRHELAELRFVVDDQDAGHEAFLQDTTGRRT